jgi:cell division protein FtsA
VVAEHVRGLPTRRGSPTRVGGLVDVVRSPAYSTGVGLVAYGAAQGRQAASRNREAQVNDRGLIKRAWTRLAEMF